MSGAAAFPAAAVRVRRLAELFCRLEAAIDLPRVLCDIIASYVLLTHEFNRLLCFEPLTVVPAIDPTAAADAVPPSATMVEMGESKASSYFTLAVGSQTFGDGGPEFSVQFSHPPRDVRSQESFVPYMHARFMIGLFLPGADLSRVGPKMNRLNTYRDRLAVSSCGYVKCPNSYYTIPDRDWVKIWQSTCVITLSVDTARGAAALTITNTETKDGTVAHLHFPDLFGSGWKSLERAVPFIAVSGTNNRAIILNTPTDPTLPLRVAKPNAFAAARK